MDLNPERRGGPMEFHRAVEEQDELRRQAEYFKSMDAYLNAGQCPYCGGWDGLDSWYREDVEALPPGELESMLWYRVESMPDRRYSPCGYCDNNPSEDFEEVLVEEIREWMAR